MQKQGICLYCGTEFSWTPIRVGGRPREYCSVEHRVAANNARAASRGYKGNTATSWPRNVIMEAAICAAYRSGLSCGSIAKQHGVADETIARVLRRNGIEKRDRNAPTLAKRLKGGRIQHGSGYVYVRVEPDDPLASMATQYGHRYALEHRIVMARHLGRPLHKHETVHHKNGKRDDNRLENLEHRMGAHGKGQRVDDIVDFLVEHHRDRVIERINAQGKVDVDG